MAFYSKRDVYLEIAERYEKYISLGIIKPGEKLPSVRAAAAELRVNPNTVVRAYSLLEVKGLIRSMPKKGAFVTFDGKSETGKRSFPALTSELLRLKADGATKEEIILVLEEVFSDD